VIREFPAGTAERVLQALRNLPSELVGGQDAERVQAALVLRAQGDWLRFLATRDLAERDWRDALVARISLMRIAGAPSREPRPVIEVSAEGIVGA
jgi:hypothetical protein